MAILDTSFLIDVMRADAAATSLVDELEAGSDALYLPTVVLYELWEGVERSRQPLRERDAVDAVLRACTILPLQPAHAARAGTLSGSLQRRGLRLEDVDLMIAGTALCEQHEVVTRNARDFERIPDLRVRTY